VKRTPSNGPPVERTPTRCSRPGLERSITELTASHPPPSHSLTKRSGGGSAATGQRRSGLCDAASTETRTSAAATGGSTSRQRTRSRISIASGVGWTAERLVGDRHAECYSLPVRR
jgi:hypothetical protein